MPRRTVTGRSSCRTLLIVGEGDSELAFLSHLNCLEGLLLHVLGRPVPERSDHCKQALHPLLAGRATEPRSYATLFPRELLDERCANVESLAQLRRLMQGQPR